MTDSQRQDRLRSVTGPPDLRLTPRPVPFEVSNVVAQDGEGGAVELSDQEAVATGELFGDCADLVGEVN
jgi:hypothetical protein